MTPEDPARRSRWIIDVSITPAPMSRRELVLTLLMGGVIVTIYVVWHLAAWLFPD